MSETPPYAGVEVLGAPRVVTTIRLAVKRAVDIAASSLLLAALSPLMVLIAIAIKLDSRGPVLFKQERVGSKREMRGRTVYWRSEGFTILKFRSMRNGADDAMHRSYTEAFVKGDLEESPDARSDFKINGDPRVTRVGKVLRRASLDELPQLVNVLRGDMSLVGPRPVPPYEVAAYEGDEFVRLHAKPGITGYWQVHGRGSVPFDVMVEMDLYYVRNHTLWLDFKLLLQTLPAVVSTRGAE